MGNLNLVVAGISAVGAAALHSGLVLAIGGAAYVALVAWDLATPEFWTRDGLGPDGREDVKLPDRSSLTDPDVLKAVKDLEVARLELSRVMRQSPEQVHRYLSLALSSLRELQVRAAALAMRGEELSRYLFGADPRTVERAIADLDGQLSRTQDEEARAHYQEAKAARVTQLEALREISRSRERVLANLASIVATIEGLPAKVVRMKLLDAQAMDAMSGDVTQEIGRMNDEIKAFEETLRGLHTEAVRE